jgi:hypothetical protein
MAATVAKFLAAVRADDLAAAAAAVRDVTIFSAMQSAMVLRNGLLALERGHGGGGVGEEADTRGSLESALVGLARTAAGVYLVICILCVAPQHPAANVRWVRRVVE